MPTVRWKWRPAAVTVVAETAEVRTAVTVAARTEETVAARTVARVEARTVEVSRQTHPSR